MPNLSLAGLTAGNSITFTAMPGAQLITNDTDVIACQVVNSGAVPIYVRSIPGSQPICTINPGQTLAALITPTVWLDSGSSGPWSGTFTPYSGAIGTGTVATVAVSGLSVSNTATPAAANSALVTAAIALVVAAGGGTVLIPPGTYYFSATMAIPSGVTIAGSGRSNTILKRYTTFADGDLFTVVGADANNPVIGAGMRDLTLDGVVVYAGGIGGTYTTTKEADATTAGGLKVAYAYDFVCDRVNIINWSRHGVLVQNTSGGGNPPAYTRGPHFSDCYIAACWIGWYCNTSGEYSKLVNCELTLCAVNCRQDSGNTAMIGCTMSGYGVVGNYGLVMVGTGNTGIYTNGQHGVCLGCQFNHCTGAAVVCLDVVYGHVFTGCVFLTSIILTTCVNIQISDSLIVGEFGLYLDGGSGIVSGLTACSGSSITVNRDYNGNAETYRVDRIWKYLTDGVTLVVSYDPTVRPVSADATLKVNRETIINVTAACTVTLPSAPWNGQTYAIRNGSGGTITIGRGGKEINGASSDLSVTTAVTTNLFYDGTGWFTQ